MSQSEIKEDKKVESYNDNKASSKDNDEESSSLQNLYKFSTSCAVKVILNIIYKPLYVCR